MTDQKERPCIEEFIASGNDARHYDGMHPKEQGWGPAWSNPDFHAPTPDVEASQPVEGDEGDEGDDADDDESTEPQILKAGDRV